MGVSLRLSHPSGEKSAKMVASPDGPLIADDSASGRTVRVEITALKLPPRGAQSATR
jgi:hypothetical protein